MKPEFKRANDRFIKIMNVLISEKKCKNKSDFANKLKTLPSTITHISDYTQNIPYPLLFELYNVFGISINYILFNEGQPRLTESRKDTLEDLILRAAELVRKSP